MTTTPARKPGPPASRTARARSYLRAMGRTQFTCHCGCNRQWKDHRLMNAHMLKNYGRYWGGKGGAAMGRKIGKGQDSIRRMGRGGLEAFGHVDRTGRRTPKASARPGAPESGHLSRRFLRDAARHDRHTARAADRHGKAARLIDGNRGGRVTRRIRAAGPVRGVRHGLAARHIRKGNDLRAKADRVSARHPERPPAAPRPAPAPRARQNGHSPNGRAPEPRVAPRPAGRLAPVPDREPRTRTPR